MIITTLILASAALAADTSETAPWRPGVEFPSHKGCVDHLGIVGGQLTRMGKHLVVEGPYKVSPNESRMLSVRQVSDYYAVDEYRCEDKQMTTRAWRETFDENATPETIRAWAKAAEWVERPE